jgi:hypothetical protein
VSSTSKIPDCVVAHRSDRCSSPVRPVPTSQHRSDRYPPVRPTGQTGLPLLQHRLRFSGLGFVDEPRNPVVFWGTTRNPTNSVFLRQSPLMTWLPRSPGSTLVLRLHQETVHDFILLFMPPCGPHLTPLATGSLERSLLVFSTPGGLTGDDISCLFFTCTNTSHTATCTCNT